MARVVDADKLLTRLAIAQLECSQGFALSHDDVIAIINKCSVEVPDTPDTPNLRWIVVELRQGMVRAVHGIPLGASVEVRDYDLDIHEFREDIDRPRHRRRDASGNEYDRQTWLPELRQRI